MSQFVVAQVFVAAAIVLLVVHRWVTNRWLAMYERRHRSLPGTDWWRTPDRDAEVEHWRRLRILALIPTAIAFATALALLFSAR